MTRSGGRWTGEDDERLTAMALAGEADTAIGAALGRSRAAVEGRRRVLAAVAAAEIADRAAGGHAGRVDVTVPAAWAPGRRDTVALRVSASVQRMHRAGHLGEADLVAAGYVHSVIEASETGGVGAIDYSIIRVDGSVRERDGVAHAVIAAHRADGRLRRLLGAAGYQVVRAVCYEGRTVMDVAIGWPTAIRGNGGVDQGTRKFIGRLLAEGLGAVYAAECRAFGQGDPQAA